ncbi:MAG: glycosyltransferase family 2 protein [Agrobacterium cavarae]
MKSVILVQVKNSYGYLPAFIAHHQRLVDKIIIMDHNSDRHLSGLARPGVETIRISAAFYAQDLYAAYFIKALNLRRDFDFLFLLDIDEFLPFQSKEEFSGFLEERRDCGALSMYWRNGFSVSSNPLNAHEKISFTTWRSSTKKMIYNLKKVPEIMPIVGNHNAKYPLLDSLLIQARPKRQDSSLGLLHIPFLGLDGLRRKIREFPKAFFGEKLFKDFRYLDIEIDPALPQFGLSEEDLLLFVANYRTKPSDMRRDVNRSTFEEIDFLSGLDDQIKSVSNDLDNCEAALAAPKFFGEFELVTKLRANRIFVFRRLRRAFGLQSDGTYSFNLPRQ